MATEWTKTLYGSGARLKMAPGFALAYWWDAVSPKGAPDSGNYICEVNGLRLKRKAKSGEEARKMLLDAAEQIIQTATKALAEQREATQNQSTEKP